jgi:hypothetical protein
VAAISAKGVATTTHVATETTTAVSSNRAVPAATMLREGGRQCQRQDERRNGKKATHT